MKTLAPLLIATLALSAGCSKAPQPPAVENGTTNAAATPENIAAPVEAPATLTCDNGFTIAARYDNSDPQNAKAILTINGKEYTLNSAVTASGARYTSEAGMTPDMLLEWRTKGDEASLYESPLDDSVTPEDVKLRATCKTA